MPVALRAFFLTYLLRYDKINGDIYFNLSYVRLALPDGVTPKTDEILSQFNSVYWFSVE